jgi:hypothetical protein
MNTPPIDITGDFVLGKMLGQRRAFGIVAGRCSAAEAETIRRIRDEKLFLHRADNWDEFAPAYLGITSRHANRIIRMLGEFGPAYFELAQLTRVSPEQFRAIAPSVREQGLEFDGEIIALVPENAEKLTAAVAELRKNSAADDECAPSTRERLEILEKRCRHVIGAFAEVAESGPEAEEREALLAAVRRAVAELTRIEVKMAA